MGNILREEMVLIILLCVIPLVLNIKPHSKKDVPVC